MNCLLPQVLYNLLGDAYSQLKQTEEAEKWYKAALQAKPDHVPAHLTYGKLLAKNVSILSGHLSPDLSEPMMGQSLSI